MHDALTRDQKDATEATRATNEAFFDRLDFDDRSEYDNACRGLLAAPKDLEIRNACGRVIWSQKAYAFVEGAAAPATCNPSLWEDTRRNHAYGLFKVIDGIYQVRGYDMANLTLIEGDRGWVVFDCMMGIEVASAALRLANDTLGERPVTAVVISHTHVDHYGGIKGLISEEDACTADMPLAEQLAGTKVPIIVPAGFTGHVVSENLYVGPAMGRRAAYQYGAYLPKGPKGSLSMGIGCGQSTGTTSFISPSWEITHTGEELVVDGIRMVFQMTPGTEAPAEMNTWLPDRRALWMAENCTGSLHNLYTLRGAQVRDGNAWANYIAETVSLWGAEVDVCFQSHNWPHWGNACVNDYLVNSAAAYKYINDRTLSYIEDGLVSTEIAHRIQLPPTLRKNWYTRQYYGTVSHNAKAVYQRFMGWYDANPIHLGQLPPEDFAKKLVEYLGDVDAVLERARADFERGEYQWVAEITNALVFADPANEEARLLCADALEQLAFATASGTWRSCYLTGATELRHGNLAVRVKSVTRSTDVRDNLTSEMLWDFLGICLDKDAFDGRDIKINVALADTSTKVMLRIVSGALLHFPNMWADDADITLRGTTGEMLLIGSRDLALLRDHVEVSGDEAILAEIMDAMDFPSGVATFNIVEP